MVGGSVEDLSVGLLSVAGGSVEDLSVFGGFVIRPKEKT